MVAEPPIVPYKVWDSYANPSHAWVGYSPARRAFYVNARTQSPADQPYDEVDPGEIWWGVETTLAFVERALANGATIAWGGVLPDNWGHPRLTFKR